MSSCVIGSRLRKFFVDKIKEVEPCKPEGVHGSRRSTMVTWSQSIGRSTLTIELNPEPVLSHLPGTWVLVQP